VARPVALVSGDVCELRYAVRGLGDIFKFPRVDGLTRGREGNTHHPSPLKHFPPFRFIEAGSGRVSFHLSSETVPLEYLPR
jgi:hypothetical protein